MKLTKSEAERVLELVDKEHRRLVSQQKGTKAIEKLRGKIEAYLSQKGFPNK
jgi:hypothetical protein